MININSWVYYKGYIQRELQQYERTQRPTTDQFHKSHKAPVAYPTMRHSEQICAYFFSFLNGALWDMEQVHWGICEWRQFAGKVTLPWLSHQLFYFYTSTTHGELQGYLTLRWEISWWSTRYRSIQLLSLKWKSCIILPATCSVNWGTRPTAGREVGFLQTKLYIWQINYW